MQIRAAAVLLLGLVLQAATGSVPLLDERQGAARALKQTGFGGGGGSGGGTGGSSSGGSTGGATTGASPTGTSNTGVASGGGSPPPPPPPPPAPATPTPSPTSTPSPSPTSTPSPSPTSTPSPSPTSTPSPSPTSTPKATSTPSPSPTSTPSPSPTSTPSPSPTSTPSPSPTSTPSPSPTSTPSPSPTSTPKATSTPSPSPTSTPSPSPTSTPSPSPTSTPSPSPTSTPSPSPTQSVTPLPTQSATPTPTPTRAAAPPTVVATPTPVPTTVAMPPTMTPAGTAAPPTQRSTPPAPAPVATSAAPVPTTSAAAPTTSAAAPKTSAAAPTTSAAAPTTAAAAPTTAAAAPTTAAAAPAVTVVGTGVAAAPGSAPVPVVVAKAPAPVLAAVAQALVPSPATATAARPALVNGTGAPALAPGTPTVAAPLGGLLQAPASSLALSPALAGAPALVVQPPLGAVAPSVAQSPLGAASPLAAVAPGVARSPLGAASPLAAVAPGVARSPLGAASPLAAVAPGLAAGPSAAIGAPAMGPSGSTLPSTPVGAPGPSRTLVAPSLQPGAIAPGPATNAFAPLPARNVTQPGAPLAALPPLGIAQPANAPLPQVLPPSTVAAPPSVLPTALPPSAFAPGPQPQGQSSVSVSVSPDNAKPGDPVTLTGSVTTTGTTLPTSGSMTFTVLDEAGKTVHVEGPVAVTGGGQATGSARRLHQRGGPSASVNLQTAGLVGGSFRILAQFTGGSLFGNAAARAEARLTLGALARATVTSLNLDRTSIGVAGEPVRVQVFVNAGLSPSGVVTVTFSNGRQSITQAIGATTGLGKRRLLQNGIIFSGVVNTLPLLPGSYRTSAVFNGNGFTQSSVVGGPNLYVGGAAVLPPFFAFGAIIPFGFSRTFITAALSQSVLVPGQFLTCFASVFGDGGRSPASLQNPGFVGFQLTSREGFTVSNSVPLYGNNAVWQVNTFGLPGGIYSLSAAYSGATAGNFFGGVTTLLPSNTFGGNLFVIGTGPIAPPILVPNLPLITVATPFGGGYIGGGFIPAQSQPGVFQPSFDAPQGIISAGFVGGLPGIPTAVSLQISPGNNVAYGQTILITAFVQSLVGVPTGLVTISVIPTSFTSLGFGKRKLLQSRELKQDVSVNFGVFGTGNRNNFGYGNYGGPVFTSQPLLVFNGGYGGFGPGNGIVQIPVDTSQFGAGTFEVQATFTGGNFLGGQFNGFNFFGPSITRQTINVGFPGFFVQPPLNPFFRPSPFSCDNFDNSLTNFVSNICGAPGVNININLGRK